ncbi:hypothetical protein ABPG75_000805 [Micractinium tetrahymenae]
MCGRSRCSLGEEQVARAAGTSRWADRQLYRPSHNVAPGAATPVVRVASDGERQVQSMRWGLVPSFTKKDEKPDFWRMYNARSESVAEKPSFRRLVPTRRCLVLTQGFYEWQKEKGGAKQPYYIQLASPEGGEEEPLVMAGLWDVWDGPEGPMHTYTILTCDSSKRLEWLHDRMPVILRTREAQETWLQPGDNLGKLLHMCVPYNGEDLVWHPVTKQMNSPSFQGPECCKEVKKPSAKDFFKPRSAVAASPKVKEQGKLEFNQEPGKAGSSQRDQQGQQAQQAQQAAIKDEQGVKTEAGSAGLPAQTDVQQTAAAAAVNADEPPADRQQAAVATTAGRQAAANQAAEKQAAEAAPKQQEGQQGEPQAAAGASPASGQKRKQPAGSSASKGSGGSGGKKGSAPGSASKKARPAGQRPISHFFSKG